MARSSIPNMQESSSFISVTGDLLKLLIYFPPGYTPSHTCSSGVLCGFSIHGIKLNLYGLPMKEILNTFGLSKVCEISVRGVTSFFRCVAVTSPK